MTESSLPPDTAKPLPPDHRQINQLGMLIHLGLLAGFLIPLAGLVVPIVLCQLKKDEHPVLDEHGKIVVDWILSALIYGLVCAVLSLVLIGIVGFYAALAVATVAFAIIGGVKANDGIVWEYPLSIRFLK